jgi:hypothetical protein
MLCKFDMIRSENSQEEWPFLILLALNFSVWNNDVMAWLLLISRS